MDDGLPSVSLIITIMILFEKVFFWAYDTSGMHGTIR